MTGCEFAGHGILIGFHGAAGAWTGGASGLVGATALNAWGHHDVFGGHMRSALAAGALGGLVLQGTLGALAQCVPPARTAGATLVHRGWVEAKRIAAFGTCAAVLGAGLGTYLLREARAEDMLSVEHALQAGATGAALLAALIGVTVGIPSLCLYECVEASERALGRGTVTAPTGHTRLATEEV